MSIKYFFLIFALFLSSSLYSKNKIIFLGIDGLGGTYLNEDISPNILAWMKKDSAYTTEMQNVLPAWSATNWYSMFSASTTNQHNIKGNLDKISPNIPPTYFDVLFKSHSKMRVHSVHMWENLNELVGGGGNHKNEFFEKDEQVLVKILEIIKSKNLPDFLFTYFGDVDHEGHLHKWGSDEYLDAIREVDRKVGEIISLLKKRKLFKKTFLALSSDHGGEKMAHIRSIFEHGGDQYKVRSIPFIISGPNIRKGLIKEEVRIFDIFPTFAKIQGVKKLPNSWVGRSIDSVFKGRKTKKEELLLSLKYSDSFKLILSNKRGWNFKALRPTTLNTSGQKFFPFGDIISTRNHPKRKVVMAPLISGITAHPIGFEKILNNRKSFFNPYNFTTFSPIPPFGYLCPGEVFVLGITTVSPKNEDFICVKSEYLSKISSKRVWNSLFLMQAKYGISFWTPKEERITLAPLRTFYSRRMKKKQGLNKSYQFKEDKIQIIEK